jgi:EmrB/QacA subfamily drug resistance transporter
MAMTLFADARTVPLRPKLVISVMTLAALMDLLDITVVNVALPTLRTRLQASGTELEWLLAGYMLAFGATLVLWGRIGDLVGRKPVFLAAVAAFGAASLGAGLAPNIGCLVGFRIAQGAAAGALVPQVLATYRTVLDDASRVAAFGIYGAVACLAAALGVILGGLLTQYSVLGLGWRAIFLVNVPIAVGVLVVGVSAVPDSRPARPCPLDPAAAVLLPVSLAAIIYALLEGRGRGWPFWLIALLTAGLAGVGLTAKLEWVTSARRAPLLNIQQFTQPAFSAGIAIQALFSAALQGFSLVFVLWLQVGHHYTPLHTGLTLLAFSAGAMVTAPRAGQLAEKRGRGVLAVGAVLLAAGVGVVGVPAWQGAAHIDPATTLAGLAVAGAGLGWLVVPLINVVLVAVPRELAGGASGTFTTAQQLGGSIGVAMLGSLFFSRAAGGTLDGGFRAAVVAAMAAYCAAAILCSLLPGRGLSEAEVLEVTDGENLAAVAPDGGDMQRLRTFNA